MDLLVQRSGLEMDLVMVGNTMWRNVDGMVEIVVSIHRRFISSSSYLYILTHYDVFLQNA